MAIKYYDTFMKTLIDGVKPALGCTEPVAVGLAVAKAYEGFKGQDIEEIDVKVTPNIFKNGMGVGIPGTKEIGLVFAAALGATCGDANIGLEVFKPVNDVSIEHANRLIEEDRIHVGIEHNEGNFFIGAKVTTSEGYGYCEIRDFHTNITFVKNNDEVIFDNYVEKEVASKENIESLKDVEIADIRNFVEGVPFEDIEFLLEGVKVNMQIAEYGLENQSGVGLGAALNKLSSEGVIQKDIVNEARVLTSAACDARMSGVNMPVMSSGGSGNQGITAIIPPTLICEDIGCDDEKLARTLAYSHIMSSFIKEYTGKLAPVCGCGISAGIGASASIAWALGGDDDQIGGAIKNMVGTLAGMVCDGAKGGCAFKISTAASEAIIQAKLSMEGIIINDTDGIVNPDVKQTIINLGDFSKKGMKDADEEIINIMLKNH